jgi:hypothetical protein
MLITLAEAARMARLTKGAIRKAVEHRKLTATRDEQGRLRVQAADVERVWPHRALAPAVTSDQRAPVPDGDRAPRAPGDHDIEVRLAVAEALLGEREREITDLRETVADLRRRLDQAEAERRQITLALTDQRPQAELERPSWWRRWWRES